MDATSSAQILLVEDHCPTRTFLADNLTADGFEVLPCTGLAPARQLLRSERPTVAVLDLGLPDGDGLELVAEIRDAPRGGPLDPELPLVILTGRAAALDRLRGFDRGCDDYVVKPFSYPELRARLLALLRRTERRVGGPRLRVGPLEVDSLARAVWVHGEPVSLSKKEFALLRALAEDPLRVYTREELLRGVWGFQSLCATRTLDSHASRLRRKLRRDGVNFVVNVWGVGYRLLDGPVDG